MRIVNRSLVISRRSDTTCLESLAGPLVGCLGPDSYPLRFCIVEADQLAFHVEVTAIEFTPGQPFTSGLSNVELLRPRSRGFQAPSFAVVQVVPTGIRCEFGGYAGDATPITNLLASVADVVVTHPNAVNASDLNEMAGNVLYVEGKSLDDFMLGHVALRPTIGNRIGTFVDPTGLDQIDDIIHAINAARAAAGIACNDYLTLESNLGVTVNWTRTGCASGCVGRPLSLLQGVQRLISRGAAAIGGVSVIHGVADEMFQGYMTGSKPNPSGAVEAVISHLISKVFRVPTAHAPLPYYLEQRRAPEDNARAAAEFISRPHYFSVLKGLHRAPQTIPRSRVGRLTDGLVTLEHVAAVVAPASALGGVPMLAAEYYGIPLIAVRENQTILDVTNQKLRMPNVIEVDSYLEAAGLVTALKAGISIESLRRPLRTCRDLRHAVGDPSPTWRSSRAA